MGRRTCKEIGKIELRRRVPGPASAVSWCRGRASQRWLFDVRYLVGESDEGVLDEELCFLLNLEISKKRHNGKYEEEDEVI